VPLSERFEEPLTVLVAEVLDDIDEEERVLQRSVGSSSPARANE
jgi:hypothetical protein